MNLDRYLQIREQVLSTAKDTEDKKRASYTSGNENVLHNFVRDGEIAGIPPMQNWLAHFLKQVAAIVSFVKNPEIEPSEPLVSRAADLINYAVLMVAMAEDSGRDTGLALTGDVSPTFKDNLNFYSGTTWLEKHKPIFKSSLPPFSFVALADKDKEIAKVLNDFYAYTFGYDRSEEPWKD